MRQRRAGQRQRGAGDRPGLAPEASHRLDEVGRPLVERRRADVRHDWPLDAVPRAEGRAVAARHRSGVDARADAAQLPLRDAARGQEAPLARGLHDDRGGAVQ